MIDSALLDRLRQADLETWQRYSDENIGEFFYTDHNGDDAWEEIQESQLYEKAKEAWLQHVMQDAIRARGWGLYQTLSLKGGCWKRPYAMISDGVRAPLFAEGDSPAEALLRAYLAAIEVT